MRVLTRNETDAIVGGNSAGVAIKLLSLAGQSLQAGQLYEWFNGTYRAAKTEYHDHSGQGTRTSLQELALITHEMAKKLETSPNHNPVTYTEEQWHAYAQSFSMLLSYLHSGETPDLSNLKLVNEDSWLYGQVSRAFTDRTYESPGASHGSPIESITGRTAADSNMLAYAATNYGANTNKGNANGDGYLKSILDSYSAKGPIPKNGTDGDEFLTGELAGDELFGMGGDDVLVGGGGDDHLWGGTGNDGLRGDDGNDILRGGPGFDNYEGGNGKDIFVFDKRDDSHTEIITGFEVGIDILKITGDMASLKYEDFQQYTDAGAHRLTLSAGDVNIILSGMEQKLTPDNFVFG